ncbi:hypothetical protein [Motilimonas eburnea]|uniref:hypothetical protein n=1 Tax=Motilimonas eburnea TaxID=1737488 RepID=UPI001E5935FD|nr:hypothetical protein [Motilimonas eburnea]MCE2571682.1 hypothetical protein [Motilimonas eburnea]
MKVYIERHARNNLKKKGYDELENIHFSLGYCQGDGICCTGYISNSECKEKATELSMSRKDIRELVKFLDDEDVYIEVSHSGGYYHSKSIRFEAINAGLAEPEMEQMLDELVAYICDEVTDTLDSILADCYALIEASPVDDLDGAFEIKTIRTKRLKLEVKLVYCDNVDDCVEMWDEAVIDECIEQMLAGVLVHGALYIGLHVDDEHTLLANEYYGNTQLVKKGDKYPLIYHDFVRSFIRDYANLALKELGVERKNVAERDAGRVARAFRRETAIAQEHEQQREREALEKQQQEDALFTSLWQVSTNNPLTLNL